MRDSPSRPVDDALLAFDVTFLFRRYFERPTGIDRVQLEIAVELLRSGEHIEFFRHDDPSGRFVRVENARVDALARQMRGLDPVRTDTVGHQKPSLATRLRVGLRRRVAWGLRRWPESSRHVLAASGYAKRSLVQAGMAVRAFPKEVNKTRSTSGLMCVSHEWSGSTTVVSLGMDFARYSKYLGDRRDAQGFKVVLVVYDLIPIVRPQYATIEFVPFIETILGLADTVLVISETTHADLARFADERGHILPPVCQIPLGSVLTDLPPVCPSALQGLGNGGPYDDFVLFVSTLTLRKNHHLLFDIWEGFAQRFDPADFPDLVIAGQRGPLSVETQSRLDRTPEFAAKVHHVEGATDDEIAWLYRHCAFTVYPSLYEGWGLPVSESHDFGKLCLSSDRASLPEAADGLADLLDPVDRAAWSSRIMHFWADRDARHIREAEITRQHRRVTARDSTDVVLRIAGLGPVPSQHQEELP